MRAGKKSADAVGAEKRANAQCAFKLLRLWSEGRKKQGSAREETEGKLGRDLKSKGTTTTVVSQRVQRAEAVEPRRAWRRRSLGGTLRILLTDSAVREPMASDATDLASS